ncbi:D-TA family PLP-dependent enzyme [Singulisphaera acidiphila]|uniref:Putative amino acid aldolase or racemase n=1 Tax=Singulisphaera acidiphila (strain ATCC BAA-1392 / DSM 18658 / VKM B-2454 / MOB10) TaxID=886293 RepID=L0DAB1_SINAD|nr:D-TA family PLP-dependent enzyme [Singulisphaera acidiphila]AGA25591.1 putative amino acid aldolase or racemase [Singulisphaera acidiphila DSM 18658]
MDSRYPLNDTSRLLSPSLLIFRTILERNLEAMIALAGGADRLRPHVKTHKMAEIVRLAERKGIHKHKCATIAEAEMVAQAGGTDVLLGYPIVGPNIDRLARLIRGFPETLFRVLVDHPDSARALSSGLEGLAKPLSVLIDLEVGMGRTGIEPGASAEELALLIEGLPNLVLDGLHAYDGHIQEADLDERKRAAAPGVEKTLRLQERLRQRGIAVPLLVLGGTPTFPVHAALDRPGVECSPGTCTLHDNGYATKFPDLPFVPAAVLLTRVVSHPRPGRLCLDLGHKAVAADPVGARLALLDIPEATLGGQSEEHLVVETPHADQFPPGTVVLAIPTHICPTCALHRRVYVIEEGELVDEWDVTARDRSIGF